MTEEKHKELEQLLLQKNAEGLEISLQVLTGTLFVEIIRYVQSQGHDLVVKTASGRTDALAELFGSTDLHLLRRCPCPV